MKERCGKCHVSMLWMKYIGSISPLQNRNINCRFHSEAKLPLVMWRPLTNQIITSGLRLIVGLLLAPTLYTP